MNKKILVLDDDSMARATLTRALVHEGWLVDVCSDAEQTLEQLNKHLYDCVLLDMQMTELRGMEFFKKLRSLEAEGKLQKQKIIVLGNYADDQLNVNAFGINEDHLLQKPINFDVLFEKIALCVNEKSSDVLSSMKTDLSKAKSDSLIKLSPRSALKKIRKSYEKVDLNRKVECLSEELNVPLKHIKGCTYDSTLLKGNIENPLGIVQIPLGLTGPLLVQGKYAKGEFWVPMATTEGALLLTYDLGMRLSSMDGGIQTEVLSKVVHITPMFPIITDENIRVSEFVDQFYKSIKEVAESGSRHTKLLGIEKYCVGNNFLLKFKYDTEDAQGLNMINQASFNACKFIESKTGAPFFHRSHYSGVKHHSLLNEKEGYGRKVKAWTVISSKALTMLRVTAAQMEDFFDRCIQCGHAAGIESVNVHAANAVAAIFVACGQDVADLSSSHACSTRVKVENGKDLYIETVLKNLLVATVGGGTVLPTQQECLKIMQCAGGDKSDRFAEIVAATALAGEFPTAAAVITQTYVDIHNKYGRNKFPK